MAKAGLKAQRTSDAAARPMGLRRSARNLSQKGADPPVKQEEQPAKAPATPKPKPGKKRVRVKEEEIKEDDEPPTKVAKKNSSSSPSSTPRVSKSIKTETGISSPTKDDGDKKPGKSAAGKEADLRAKKLKSYAQFANKSPYPAFARPTPEECQRAYDVLSALHGERQRPIKLTAPTDRAGCGDAPSVLDALVRTILSQNTSNKNSTRAKLDMDAVYGRGDSEARWEAIAAGGAAKLEKAIARGGLGGVKSRVIMGILEQVKERYGVYSLDHLLRLEAEGDDGDEAAMRELISFKGVGPKTASCVLLFCVGRDSFAVDTHVHRLTGMLGWRPPSASRDETFAHLDARIPDPLKYGLHVLFVTHGRECAECKAGGKVLGRCELRKAFRRGKADADEVKEEDGDGGEEEEEDVKSEAMDS